MSIDFVAIDFETANSSKDSACALGAAVVKDGKIVERRYTLINPKMAFDPFCTYIHGIKAKDVKAEPTFEQIYPAVFELLDGQYVAAHNASFDIGVLQYSCESRGIKIPEMKPVDSVAIAQNAWPYFPKYRLNVLAEHFSIPLKHHNAVEDATASAQIILKAFEEFPADSISGLMKILIDNKRMYTEMTRKSKAATQRINEEHGDTQIALFK